MENVKNKKRFWVYLLITLAIMAAIFIFSAQDGSQSGDFSDGFLKSLIGNFLSGILPPLTDKGFDYDIRKYAHMFEYFCLGVSSFLMFSELFFERGRMLLKTSLSSAFFCFLYACSDEFHQRFVPGRAGRFADVGVDSIGYCTAVLLMLIGFILMRQIKKGKEKNSK